MKVLLFLLLVLSFSACDNKAKFGFTSKDCDEVYNNCINKCSQTNSYNSCLSSCEQSSGMCKAIKVKGCMQDCNIRYGKGTDSAEVCKQRCKDNRI